MLKKRKPLQLEFAAWVAAGFLSLVFLIVTKQSFCEQPRPNPRGTYSDSSGYQRAASEIHYAAIVKQWRIDRENVDTDYREYLKRSGLCEEAKLTDLLLVFFTYCLVIVGWFTIRSNERSVHDLERADVSGIPKEELIKKDAQQRAYRLQIRNYGRTRAIIRTINIASRIGPPNIATPSYDNDRTRRLNATLPPTGEEAIPAPFLVSVAPDHDVIFGFIEYEDIFRQSHTSRFCVQMLGEERGAQVIGPPAWSDWN